MDPSRTITEIKLSFIRDQIRVLTAALDPSPDWRDYGPRVEDDIDDRTVNDVLEKLNTILRRHNRSVFSTQATHHVAQQIERLYWNSVDPESNEESLQPLVIDKVSDLTNSNNISRLPEQWPEEDASDEDQTRYHELRQRLIMLDAERKKRENLLAQYKQLKELLEPFNEPGQAIQPNLVTKDGELGAELDRMRMLVAKAASKIAQTKGNERLSGREQTPALDSEGKLSALLDMT